MNIRFLVITLAVPACLLAGEPDGARGRVAQESLMQLKMTFRYQPTVSQETEETDESSNEVVKMAPHIVVASRIQHDLGAKIESEALKIKSEQFSIIKGGTIYQIGRIKIGAWGETSGFKFLQYSF